MHYHGFTFCPVIVASKEVSAVFILRIYRGAAETSSRHISIRLVKAMRQERNQIFRNFAVACGAAISKKIIKPIVPRKLHCIKPFFKFFYAVCSLYERPEHHRRSGGNNNQQYPIVMPIHFKARFAVRFFILSSSFRSNLSFGSQTVKIKATRAQSASIPAS